MVRDKEARLLPSGRDTIIEALLMMMAIVPVMVSAYASLVTDDGQWFQRSGALMVLFSIGVEYHRKHMLACLQYRNGLLRVGLSAWLAHLLIRFWRTVPYVCYLAIVVGTLIWSYGDLLFA